MAFMVRLKLIYSRSSFFIYDPWRLKSGGQIAPGTCDPQRMKHSVHGLRFPSFQVRRISLLLISKHTNQCMHVRAFESLNLNSTRQTTVYILVTFVFLVSLASSVKFSLLGIQETTYHVRFSFFFFVVVVIHERITFERLVVACSARSVSSKGFSERGLKKDT